MWYAADVADTSSSAYYNGQQQAWRMLGIYVDCYSSLRSVEEQGDRDNGANAAATSCQRYLLWAAYIDTNYQGTSASSSSGSSGEYQYYNTDTQSWDDSACSSSATTTARCARLDCHHWQPPTSQLEAVSSINQTNWQLLGVYKEYNYASEWFEQLFKHQGYCVWDNATTYTFMQTYYDTWPQGCVAAATPTTATTSSQQQSYYIDLAPGPVLRLALYTDPICFTEQSTLTVAQQDAILAASGYLTSTQVATFNQHLVRFAACQPCLALYIHGQECQDDAGYTNVNQCMKFRTHTVLQAATLTDVQTALTQGAILTWHHFGSETTTYSPLWPAVLEYYATLDSDTVPAATNAAALATLAQLYTSSSRTSSTSSTSPLSLLALSSWYNVALAALLAGLATTLLLRLVASKWSATMERRRQWWRHRRRWPHCRESSKRPLSRRAKPLKSSSASEPLM
jgi:hypothetical protein